MALIKFIKKYDINGQVEKRKYTLMYGDPIMGDVTRTVEEKDKDGNKVQKNITVQEVTGWNGTPQVIKEMELVYAPGSNKYDNMLAFVEKCSEVLGEPFNQFYIGTITNYLNNGKDIRIIEQAVPQIIDFCNQFIEIQNINFDDYIDVTKKSKSSIFFDASEIKEVIRAACYLKVYYSIYKDMTMKISENFNREIFQKLVKNLTDSAIVLKLHKIVSSKTYEYNHTDKYMWEYIRNLCCKTPDMHISHIFNFIINYIIVTCEYDSNPIPYMISVIDESIKWILKSIYKESIIYSDTIATQDVAAVSGKDNLESYAHNNTVAALTVLAYQSLENIFDTEEKIDQFKSTIETIQEHSAFAKYFTFPLLSRITEIPYRHFNTLSISISYLLNILLYDLLNGTEWERKYPTLIKILTYYNTERPITKTTYKLKNIPQFTGTFRSFMGFKNLTAPFDIYSSIIGKINKNEYMSFIHHKNVPNFPSAKMETEIIEFYNNFFSDGMNTEIDQLRDRIDMMI